MNIIEHSERIVKRSYTYGYSLSRQCSKIVTTVLFLVLKFHPNNGTLLERSGL